MKKSKILSLQQGLTFIEFAAILVIISILAIIYIPSYINYVRRNYFHELISATTPFKIAVLDCYEKTGTIIGCSAGQREIPVDIFQAKGAIASLRVNNGVIVVVPVPAHGVQSEDTYVLTPIVTHNVLTWVATGGGVNKGYGG